MPAGHSFKGVELVVADKKVVLTYEGLKEREAELEELISRQR